MVASDSFQRGPWFLWQHQITLFCRIKRSVFFMRKDRSCLCYLNIGKVKTWWRHQMETFSALLAIVRGIPRFPANSPHKGQWRGALMFSLINDWVTNRGTGDLRRHRAHYDVIVMRIYIFVFPEKLSSRKRILRTSSFIFDPLTGR